VYPYQGVDSRHLGQQAFPVALDQASCHHDSAASARPLMFNRLGNSFMSLNAGSLQEAAGVHHDDIRVGLITGDHGSVLGELAEHFFRVHEILRAAQRDKGYLGWFPAQNSLLCTTP